VSEHWTSKRFCIPLIEVTEAKIIWTFFRDRSLCPLKYNVGFPWIKLTQKRGFTICSILEHKISRGNYQASNINFLLSILSPANFSRCRIPQTENVWIHLLNFPSATVRLKLLYFFFPSRYPFELKWNLYLY